MKNKDISDRIPDWVISCVLALMVSLVSVGMTACDSGMKVETDRPENENELGGMQGSGDSDMDEITESPGSVMDTVGTDPAWIQRLEPNEVQRNKNRAGIVKLKWATQSEENNFGFNIFRSDEKDGKYEIVNEKPIMGAGNSSTKNTYIFYDKTVRVGGEYYYYLVDIDLKGNTKKITPEIKKTVVIAYLSDKDPDYQGSHAKYQQEPAQVEESSID